MVKVFHLFQNGVPTFLAYCIAEGEIKVAEIKGVKAAIDTRDGNIVTWSQDGIKKREPLTNKIIWHQKETCAKEADAAKLISLSNGNIAAIFYEHTALEEAFNIGIYDLHSGNQVFAVAQEGMFVPITNVHVQSEGFWYLAFGENEEGYIYRKNDGTHVQVTNSNFVMGCIRSNATRYWIKNDMENITLYDKTGTLLWKTPFPIVHHRISVYFSEDETMVAATTDDLINIYLTTDGTLIGNFKGEIPVVMFFSTDANSLIVEGRENLVQYRFPCSIRILSLFTEFSDKSLPFEGMNTLRLLATRCKPHILT